MADDDTGNTTDTNRRFEIFVPSPKARINLGAPNKDSTGPFGYTGLSLQSDVHLFIDANKHTLFQTGQNYCGQVGGKWLQYSNEDMVVSSTASMNLSADKKIVIAAGSGQGQVTALDHGTATRVVPYNALALHYRVDRIQVGLFEFMHGRRKRTEYGAKTTAVLKKGGLDNEYFSRKSAGMKQEQTDSELQWGFFENSALSLRELYAVGSERFTSDHDEPVEEAGDPILLFDPLAHKRVINPEYKAKGLKYGFTPYLSRFDPYARINTGDLDNPIAKGLGEFKNKLASMRRLADVTTKYADLITDNFLAKRAQALGGAVDNLAKATWNAYHFVEIPFGAFLAGHDRGIGTASGGGFYDEVKSGWHARWGGTFFDPDNSPAAAYDAAQAGVTSQTAEVRSDRGPFDLTGKTTMNIGWSGADGSGSYSLDLTAGAAATSASLGVTIADDALLPAAATIRIDASQAPGVAPSELLEAVAQALEVRPTDLAATTQHPGASVYLKRSVMRTVLTSPATITDRVMSLTAAGVTTTVRLGDVITGIAPVHQTLRCRIAVDGAATEVSVDTSSVSTSPSWDGPGALSSALTTALGGVVTGSAPNHVITSPSTGASSQVAVLDGDASLVADLGLGVGQEERGRDAVPGLGAGQLSSVTAEQIAARIPPQAGLTVSTSGGMLVLKTSYRAAGSDSSKVEVTGSMKDVVFENADSANEVTPEQSSQLAGGAVGVEAGYKTLISWNHELQKLPEDTRNLTRPIRNAINDVVASASAIEKAAESAVEFVGEDMVGLPGAPEAIGLIADEGITLGTPDRIVGSGGKGIVFIADGGTGVEDHGKFIPKVEKFVNLSMQWDIFDVGVKWLMKRFGWAKDDVKRPPSLGFRVLSDSNADLFATTAAQLMALGRGKLSAALDGKTATGIGIARVAGSYASEMVGYRKVVVSARHRSTDPTLEGRVELAGQTIQIGAMNVDQSVADYKETGGVGIEPVKLEQLATAEHLDDDELAELKKQLEAHAWPETLRGGGDEGHPNTKRVLVHAEEETVIVVGSFLVHVEADGGVTVGQRKTDSDDPLTNELDDALPSLQLGPEEVRVSMGEKNKDTSLVLMKDKVLLYEGPTKNASARAQVQLQKGKAQLWGGKSKFEASDSAMKISSPSLDTTGTKKVKLTASGKIELG